MDLADRKILCALDANCRTPVAQIARKLRISRGAAAYRIQQLEEQGIIKAYICSLNLNALGYTTYKIYFKIRTGKEQQFVQYMMRSRNVIHCLKTEGAYEYAIAVAAKNIGELDEFLTEVKSVFQDLIRDYTVSLHIYSKIFKLDKLLLGHQQLKMEQYAVSPEASLDPKDSAILKVLAQEANLPVIKIAERTQLTIDIVTYRLRNLCKGIILSNRIMIDMPQIGYHHYVIMLRTRSSKSEEGRLVSWCRMKQNVLYCSKRIGEFDFEINAAITDISDLNAFLAELKEKCGDIIDSHEIVINTKLLKLNYVPF